MDSSAFLSPSSEENLWSSIHDHVDAILDDRKPIQSIELPLSTSDADSELGKQCREGSLLLIRGLDSVSSSLSQLKNALGTAQQGLNGLVEPAPAPPLRKSQKREIQRRGDDYQQRKAKKQCGSNLVREVEDSDGLKILGDCNSIEEERPEDEQISVGVTERENLKKARNLALSMVSKAASLAMEMKKVRTELNSLQERCAQLEGENRSLRGGFEKDAMPDEDDLVRLQLEALLAEKFKLANENANLSRENQCLHQIVEYHQLTLQDLASSYDESISGMRLNFSSPERKVEIGESVKLSDTSNA